MVARTLEASEMRTLEQEFHKVRMYAGSEVSPRVLVQDLVEKPHVGDNEKILVVADAESKRDTNYFIS